MCKYSEHKHDFYLLACKYGSLKNSQLYYIYGSKWEQGEPFNSIIRIIKALPQEGRNF